MVPYTCGKTLHDEFSGLQALDQSDISILQIAITAEPFDFSSETLRQVGYF